MSEVKQKKETTAQATTAQEAAAPVDAGEELVSVRLFKDNDKYKGDVFVAVNGQSVQIRRGERVEIKKKFGLIERESSAYEAAKDKLN